MADIVSPAKRSQMMAGINGKDTKPELQVRKALYARGFRYRLHNKKLPGKPDIVLAKYNTAIQVNGCFWHGHEDCHLFRFPKSRVEFWENKIGGNIARDKVNLEQLEKLGWRVLVIWECALKGKGRIGIDTVAEATTNFIRSQDNKFGFIRGNHQDKTAATIQYYAEFPC